VLIAPGVRRVVAPNASAMTGPGTNSYLLGEPPRAVLDPGPGIATHVDRLAALAPQANRVFVTHTHRDHSPAATPLARQLGAELLGRPPPNDGRQDTTFAPSVVVGDGDRFALQSDMTLHALATPGHASNHVCYWLEEQGLLFSGDHILDGVTPVILAPDGDMAHYLHSLARLRALPLANIAPGHGRVLMEPAAVIDGIVAHRARREHKVLASLARVRAATTDDLLPVVYSDVRRELYTFARCSLEAHLIKLALEGVCRRDGDVWRID
jgi:glyoxylase-like metal-dependent hydrolase (beta-lactamase superfamily II)